MSTTSVRALATRSTITPRLVWLIFVCPFLIVEGKVADANAGQAWRVRPLFVRRRGVFAASAKQIVTKSLFIKKKYRLSRSLIPNPPCEVPNPPGTHSACAGQYPVPASSRHGLGQREVFFVISQRIVSARIVLLRLPRCEQGLWHVTFPLSRHELPGFVRRHSASALHCRRGNVPASYIVADAASAACRHCFPARRPMTVASSAWTFHKQNAVARRDSDELDAFQHRLNRQFGGFWFHGRRIGGFLTCRLYLLGTVGFGTGHSRSDTKSTTRGKANRFIQGIRRKLEAQVATDFGTYPFWRGIMEFGVCAGRDKARILADAGYDYIELSVAADLMGVSEDDWAGRRDEILALPLPVRSFNSFIRERKIVGADVNLPRLRQYVETAMARARDVGGEVIVFGSGGARRVPDGFESAMAERQIRDFLRVCADVSEKMGVVVAIEPLNRQECNVITSIADAATLALPLDHAGVRLLADTYHMEKDGETAGGHHRVRQPYCPCPHRRHRPARARNRSL